MNKELLLNELSEDEMKDVVGGTFYTCDFYFTPYGIFYHCYETCPDCI